MRSVSGGDVTGKFHINNDDEKIKYLTCENDQVLCLPVTYLIYSIKLSGYNHSQLRGFEILC